MEIIEQYLDSKSRDFLKCEDGLYIDDNFIVVVDGVTSKGEFLWDGMTSGCYAKEIIINEMKQIPFSINSNELIAHLNKVLINKYFEKKSVIDNKELLRASVIIYSNYFKEIWSFGDCQYMINKISYNNSKRIDETLAEMRSMMIKSYILNGMTEEDFLNKDIAREAILPFLKQQQYFENSDEEYSYAVLNGKKLNLTNIKVIKVKSGDEIVLATDGYPILKSTLDESEKELNEILEKDPLCYKIYKSTKGINKINKSFDDRAYIRFKI